MTLKVVMLMSLLTGQRVQSLHYLDVRNISFEGEYVKIRIGDPLKHTRPCVHISEFVFEQYTQDSRVCIVQLLKLYLDSTKVLRKNESRLFISFCRPYKPVAKDTIAR